MSPCNHQELVRIEIGMIRSGTLSRTSGVIPVSGVRPRLFKENIMFAGDAAGLTHPITGAGIAQAVFSGLEAGKAARAILEKGSLEPLAEYERDVRARYGGSVAHARSKRTAMMSIWNEPDFTKVCERTWIGFKGYRKRES